MTSRLPALTPPPPTALLRGDRRGRGRDVRCIAAAVAALAAIIGALVPVGAAGAQTAPPAPAPACGGESAAVLVDASSEPDLYAAFLLAGVLDTGCLIDAGDRDKPLPAASRLLLDTGTLNDGYAIGGTAAVPAAKLAGSLTWRRAPGADRWATLQLIGNNAANPTGLPAAGAAATHTTGSQGSAASDCGGDSAAVLADASSDPDWYAAFLLAGTLDTGCLIDAGDRDKPLPAASRTLLDTGTLNDGYAIGGTAAVPAAKLAGSLTWRRAAGADRWATLQLIGNNAANPTGLPAADTAATPEPAPATRLTNNDAWASGPTWSPDGQRIAFTSNRGDGNLEIYVMNADGTNPTRLTNNDAKDYFPAWSPDGQRIAFTSDRDGAPWVWIYVMNADGTNPTRLTNNGVDFWPAWSPDGQRIAFTSYRDGVPGIDVMNADGTNPTRLTNNDAWDYWPAWSPDGQRIAFVSEQRDGYQGIVVMNADGTNPTRLANKSGGRRAGGGSAWSPDGQRIAFASDRDSPAGIYVMNADGTNPTRLTNNRLHASDPAWSPDGQRIAFTAERDSPAGIYIMSIAGEPRS